MNNKANPNKIVKTMGYENFDHYLDSDVFQSIIERVCETKTKCRLCKHDAVCAHATKFTYGNLSGESTKHMVGLCQRCFDTVRFTKKGDTKAPQSIISHLNQLITAKIKQRRSNREKKEERLKKQMRGSKNSHKGSAKKDAWLFR